VENHYQDLGFTELEGEPAGSRRFTLGSAQAAPRPAAFIRDLS
jgi:hypothetical protein